MGLIALGFGSNFGCDTAKAKVPFACPEGQVEMGTTCIDEYSVGVNSVGYTPGQLKRASYSAGTATFHLRDGDGKIVYTGEAKRPEGAQSPAPGGGGAGGEGGQAGASGAGSMLPTGPSNVYVADFSDFDEPGSYFVEVESGPRSPVFRIDNHVYDAALEASMLGLYGQRCGVSVRFDWEGSTFAHGACHLNDADLGYSQTGEEGHKDGTGGWHDAGDYGKYTVNGAFAAAQMLKAWEHFGSKLEDLSLPIPEAGGKTPDLLDEVRFQLEWLLEMQFSDGSAAHKLTAINFTTEIMPTFHADPRYFTPMSTAATGDLVGVLAQAARIYEKYDADFAEQMLDAATLGLDYLNEHEEHVNAPPAPNSGGVFSTGVYGDGNSQDERLWAKVEYWETTGDADVLEDIESSIDTFGPPPNWDWNQMGNLALYTYALSKREGRDPEILSSVRQKILDQADQLAAAADVHVYGRAFDQYYWGSNGVVARITMNLAVANLIEPKPEYVAAMTEQVDYLLGRNPFARSFVTGVGYYPPQHPHHRPSIADGVVPPWPGELVGGPNGGPTSWSDDQNDYTTNEVAINWTTAMVYALAAVMP